MKKLALKSISIFLALVLCLAVAVPSFAQSEKEIVRTCPRVFVPGIMSSDIYADKTNPDSEVVWPPSQDAILNTVKQALLPIGDLAVTKNFDRFGTKLADIVDELFEPTCLGYDGEPRDGTGIIFDYPAPENVKFNSEFTFDYDWRVDPLQTAAELDKFINYVLENSGCDEVVIECHSLGGVITLSYLKLFGTDKVRSVLFNSTAIYGETYTGELLQGNIAVSDDAVRYYMDFAFDGLGLNNFFSMLFGTLTDLGVLDLVSSNLNYLVDGIYDEVMPSLLKLFANWPTIWAMVPDEMLADAQKFVFGEMYEQAGIDYSGLKAKLDRYDTVVRANRADILKKVNDNANLYVISRHGYSSLPLTSSWDNISDGVIDTKYNSFGATVAKLNETLDVPAGKYVSPDKTINASTCLFPEQTWFIEDLRHNDMPGCSDDFIDTLLHYDGQATVDTFEEYPRFMKYDSESDSLIADEADVTLSFFRKFFEAIKELFNAIFKNV